MLSAKNKKRLNLLLKTFFVAVSFVYLYYKLSISDINLVCSQTAVLLAQPGKLLVLILVLVLMLFNWSIEAFKWKKLIQHLEPLSFSAALKSVLAGVTISLVTPNRAGEFAGKIFYLKKANKADAMLLSITGSLSQVLITFCAGLLAMHYYLFHQLHYTSYYSALLLLAFSIILISCSLFFNIQTIAKKWKKGNFIHQLIPYHSEAFTLSKSKLINITSLSLLRFALFSVQYYFLLHFFNLVSSPLQSFALIALYFFFISLIPTYALSELGVRGSVAIALFCPDSVSCAPVFAASLLLWIINLALPALIGAVFVFQLKFFTADNE